VEAINKTMDKADIFMNRGYCFEGRTWDMCEPRDTFSLLPSKHVAFISINRCFPPESRFELTKVFRQDDSHFIKILNQARVGLLTGPSIATLSQCRRDLPAQDGAIVGVVSLT